MGLTRADPYMRVMTNLLSPSAAAFGVRVVLSQVLIGPVENQVCMIVKYLTEVTDVYFILRSC